MARFIAGFAVGFTSVWQLTLVTLAVVPLIALAGGSYAVIMIGLTSSSQKAYAEAGEIAEEVGSLPPNSLDSLPRKVIPLFTNDYDLTNPCITVLGF